MADLREQTDMEQLTFDQFAADDAPAVKLCECGCGEPAPIAKWNNRANGHVKGQPTRFVKGHSAGANRQGPRPTIFVETGQRYGQGVVIDPEVRIPDSSSTGSHRGARLLCDCGNEYAAAPGSLIRGIPQSCGCFTTALASAAGRRGGRPIINRTGQRFGSLNVIGFVDTDRGHARWLCRCDCGTEVTVAAGSLLRAGACGCAQSAPKAVRAPGETARLRIVEQYQRSARNRGLVWELADADFDRLTSSDCFYCGQPPSTVFRAGKYAGGEFIYNGLDRVDNTAGYLADNVVACCVTCNRAKMDMPYSDFMAWIARLTEYHWFHPDVMPSRLLKGGAKA